MPRSSAHHPSPQEKDHLPPDRWLPLAVRGLGGIAAKTLASLALITSITPAAAQPATLTWITHEALPGLFSAASEDHVFFHPIDARTFPVAAEIHLQQLSKLTLNHSDSTNPKTARQERFVIRLQDSSTLLADQLETGNGGLITFQNAWTGRTSLELDQVTRIERIRSPQIQFAFPSPLISWEQTPKLPAMRQESPIQTKGGLIQRLFNPAPAADTASSKKQRPPTPDHLPQTPWQQLPDGSMHGSVWGATLSTTLPFLPQADHAFSHLFLTLAATQSIEFSLTLLQDTRRIRLESWQRTLALRIGDLLATADSAIQPPDAANSNSLQLHLIFDHRKKLATLKRAADGKTLLQLDFTTSPVLSSSSDLQLSLDNLGPNLTLQRLLIFHADSDDLPAVNTQSSFVLFTDHSESDIDLIGINTHQITYRNATQQTLRRPLDQLVAYQSRQNTESPQAKLQLQSIHQETLMAEALTLEHGDPNLNITLSDQQTRLQASLAHLHSIQPHPAASYSTPATPSPAAADTLTLANHPPIRGKSQGANQQLVHWWFNGARQAVPLPDRYPMQLQFAESDRALPELSHPPSGAASHPVILHLNNDDLINVHLLDVQQDSLQFLAPGSLRSTLSLDQIHAILFAPSAFQARHFSDPLWQPSGNLSPPADSPPQSLTLTAGTRISHPRLGIAETIEFTLTPHPELPSCVRISLLHGPGRIREDTLKLLIALVGEEIYAGDEIDNGHMRRQAQIPQSPGPLRIRLDMEPNIARLTLNGEHLLAVPINQDHHQGTQLTLESTAIWGNLPQTIQLSDFFANVPPGRFQIPQIDPDTRKQLLAIPQSRLEQPPHHALLSLNGDLLRGSIESFSPPHLILRWGMNQHQIPLDRLTAIIPLRPPEHPEPTSQPRVVHSLTSKHGNRLNVTLTRWNETELTALHPLLGHLRYPSTEISSLWYHQTPPSTENLQNLTHWQWSPSPQPEIPSPKTP